jgi:L-ascorbate metabolism protein UlaG (beta-lactamase superfamily)
MSLVIYIVVDILTENPYSWQAPERRFPVMATLTVTRVAHATVLIDLDGQAILTDPWFSQRFTYYQGEPLGVPLTSLPDLTGVIVSHGHYDHYDMQAFQAYPDKLVPFAVKRGIGQAARKVGFQHVTELDAWESTMLGPVKVTAVPGKHGVPEVTYVLEYDGMTVYFGGDTLLIPELSEIAVRFPSIDLALLSVNGLRIRPMLNRKVVMDPEEAAELCRILHPRYAVPIHYAYTAGPIGDRLLVKHTGKAQAFQQAAAQVAPETIVRILAPGEPLAIPQLQRV